MSAKEQSPISPPDLHVVSESQSQPTLIREEKTRQEPQDNPSPWETQEKRKEMEQWLSDQFVKRYNPQKCIFPEPTGILVTDHMKKEREKR